MKATLSTVTGILMFVFVHAQSPVAWQYAVKKMKGDVYELHLTASIQKGWHLFSQQQPESGIAQPTSITYLLLPEITLKGKTTEDGDRIKHKDDVLGIEQYQYNDRVDFVQELTVHKSDDLKKINITGKIVYQACTEEQCLSPTPQTFSVALP